MLDPAYSYASHLFFLFKTYCLITWGLNCKGFRMQKIWGASRGSTVMRQSKQMFSIWKPKHLKYTISTMNFI